MRTGLGGVKHKAELSFTDDLQLLLAMTRIRTMPDGG